jgi:hypothetical protein
MRARMSASRASAEGSAQHALDFGTSSTESSRPPVRASSSSKTSRAAPACGCPKCATVCTNWDIEHAPWGLPPETWAPPTSVAASSLLPTPTAARYGSSQNGDPHDGRGSFKGAGKLRLDSMAKQGRLAPHLWPTPTCQDWNHTARNLSNPKNGMTLPQAVKMWPTPIASDSRRGALDKREGRTNGPTLPEAAGGQLNPTWVEWLVGLPLGWTSVGYTQLEMSLSPLAPESLVK